MSDAMTTRGAADGSPAGDASTSQRPVADHLEVLERIQRRVLWLAVRMVDHANRERPNPDGVKVGGHQASSASVVSIMTALYFSHLAGGDRVSVKPHASPVLHAVQYLLGNLDRDYLRRLRALGGLQAYPSRTKDPDPVDFSTGSVGLGAVAPLFAAVVRRYVDAHFRPRPRNRFVALLGDAELDEGNVWEALAEPLTAGLGNVLWIVDLNRQSLDRVVPGIKAAQLEAQFREAGWHVVEAKYGQRLRERFEQPGGDALRDHIDAMSNEAYQSLFALDEGEVRERFLDGADPAVRRAVADLADDELPAVVRNLGGHDLGVLLEAFAEADAEQDRPSVVFAYTIKGWGLPIAGDPSNHSALLTGEQVDALRASAELDAASEWDRFEPGSPEADWCRQVAARLYGGLAAVPDPVRIDVPRAVGASTPATISTQEAFGRLVSALGRRQDLAPRLVTTSPDVAVSTNLGGWINRVGVFSPGERPAVATRGMLRWREHPAGQHLELGISEMNLFSLLGQLGLARELSGEQLLPIGTVYDPFVCRGLDAFIHALYSGARFVVVGTPSGVTLSPEGGAHQSTITASIGVELPGLTFAEPAYATALDWLLCDALGRLLTDDGEATYLRLSTRPVDQSPFSRALERLGEERLRADVLAGGYVLQEGEAAGEERVVLMASGAVLPEVLAAAEALEGEGVAARVVDVTSLDRLYRGWQRERRRSVDHARAPGDDFHLARLLPAPRRRDPIVTVHDAASHTMAWLGAVFGAPVVPLGVDEFGQSGTVPELYDVHGMAPGAIVNAALEGLALAEPRA